MRLETQTNCATRHEPHVNKMRLISASTVKLGRPRVSWSPTHWNKNRQDPFTHRRELSHQQTCVLDSGLDGVVYDLTVR